MIQVSDRAPGEGGYTSPEQPTVTTGAYLPVSTSSLCPLQAPQGHITDFTVCLGAVLS